MSPADFVATFRNTAESMGMTHRQLAEACIAFGFKSISKIEKEIDLIPSESTSGLSQKEEKTGKISNENNRSKKSFFKNMVKD